MKTFTLENPRQLSLDSIEQRMKIAFKPLHFQYSNSNPPIAEDTDNIISSVGNSIKVSLQDDFVQADEVEAFLETLLAPNYMRTIIEFANKFKAIDGATVIETEPSSVSIHIDGKPAGGFRLWLNEQKQPHEIEIIPFATPEGDILFKWVMNNKRDILNTNVYVAGELIRFITIL
ncbi:hypothetical protein [Pedobacter aquatilis]|uniref:hypothetical protein n=1 Tax=Pedobacter aquatilis TaxID=351343 RepID=UPI00292D5CBF|nr:hypothetical protein [Pedobacter aquatilis]